MHQEKLNSLAIRTWVNNKKEGSILIIRKGGVQKEGKIILRKNWYTRIRIQLKKNKTWKLIVGWEKKGNRTIGYSE